MRRAKKSAKKTVYKLKLYVTGSRPLSVRAIENVRAMCEKHLKGRYELEIVDLYHQPDLAKKERILAAPTLIKSLPLPARRLIGDLSDLKKVLIRLELEGGS